MIVTFLFIVIGVIVFVFIINPLTTICHELGHAIPAILLTGKKVTIYIGSLGDPNKSLKINIGLLEILFKYNPLLLRSGLCVPSAENVSIKRAFFYTLTGPITSFLIGAVGWYFAFRYDLNGFGKYMLLIFLISAIADLAKNLIPDSTPIVLYNGNVTYNDGYQLNQLYYYERFSKEYTQVTDLYDRQQYKEASVLFQKILSGGLKDEAILRCAIASYMMIKDYNSAIKLFDDFKGQRGLDSLRNVALAYSYLGMHDKALEFYDKLLQLYPDDRFALLNKGFTLNMFNRYEEAIVLFDKAIQLDKADSYPFSNRGLSKIKLGGIEEGLIDLYHSFELNEEDSYGYRNLGIYYLDNGEYQEALRLFLKAKELDGTTQLIDELIVRAEQNE